MTLFESQLRSFSQQSTPLRDSMRLPLLTRLAMCNELRVAATADMPPSALTELQSMRLVCDSTALSPAA